MDRLNKKFNILILSAGTGSRMGSVGESIPKSMIKINNKEILDYLLDKLIAFNFSEVNITVGFKKIKIIDYLKKKKIKYNLIDIKNYNKCGSVYSWYKSKNIIKNNKKFFLLLHSDLIFHNSYLEKIFKCRKQNVILTTDFYKEKTNSKSWMVYYYKFLKVLGLKKKIQNKNCSQIACINKFSIKFMKEFFDYMNKYFEYNGIDDTWEIVLNKFIQDKKKKVHVMKSKNFWFNLNTQKDLNLAKRYLNKST